MKGRFLLVIALILVLSGGRIAMAHEGDQMKHAPSTSSLKESTQSGNNMSGMDMSGKDKGMDMSGSNQGDDMEGMDMGDDGHSHEPVKESPANIKVLGTYGVVNLSFILIGVWNKWFRRKGDSNVNSK